jgi:hypothetical protein
MLVRKGVLNNCALISIQTAKWLPNRLTICIVRLGQAERTNRLTVGPPPTRKWFETLIVIDQRRSNCRTLGNS